MKNNPSLTNEQMQVLANARDKFGDTAQILVSIEELCELACVCAKYPRYDNPEEAKKELYQKILDEIADVTIVVNHIINILELDTNDINHRIAAKVQRLTRWINKGTSPDITTKDRIVKDI